MDIFVTADMHFGHANIIKYCKRPFDNIEKMNETLIRNWNNRVKKDDLVYHLGDFCFYTGKEGYGKKAQHWINQLNGKIVFIKGNHDRNNGIRGMLSYGVIHQSKKIILLTHIPPMNKPVNPVYDTEHMLNNVDIVLCGHVHEAWIANRNKNYPEVPLINVGVDVQKFMPRKLEEMIILAQRENKKGTY